MNGRGVKTVRYADDIVVLAKSKRAAERLLESCRRFLEGRLKLRMNTEKSSSSMGTAKTKSVNSLLMHSMYEIADIGDGPEVLKLYVEEMNNPNSKNTSKRAYQLQNIEKSNLKVRSSGVSPSSINQVALPKTVADLFAAVKICTEHIYFSSKSAIIFTSLTANAS